MKVESDRAVPSARRPQLFAGRYELEREISRGGMGTIWRAQDLHLDRPVAMKFMTEGYVANEGARLRFEREARAAARLGAETDYVVKIIDFGVDQETPYIAMELLQGEDLDARLSRRGRLPVREIAVLLPQIACALRRAHAIGLVHRDIKPGNIFLSSRDDEERAKLLDLGIVKEISLSARATSGRPIGTLCYMSPEQLNGEPVDHRSDLWSLGVLCYQAISGRLPFQATNLSAFIAALYGGTAPPLAGSVPDMPPGADAFFTRALARERDQRFQTAEELARTFALLNQVSWRPPAFEPAFEPAFMREHITEQVDVNAATVG